MSRIGGVFKQLKETKRKALIPYITAGDPQPGITVKLMHGMVEAGADILELGVPFSDPMAEGPVIQHAMERALEHNVSLTDVMAMVTEFRKTDSNTPVLLMGYLNPVEVMGYANFAENAAKSGVDAVLLVDIPPEEATELLKELKKHELDMIFLVSPTTSEERIELVAKHSGGFIYYVSLKGVTGAGNLDTDMVKQRVELIKKHSNMPVGVGFGIKDAESASQVAKVADAVVIGSAIVKLVEANQDSDGGIISSICDLLANIRQAMDATDT